MDDDSFYGTAVQTDMTSPDVGDLQESLTALQRDKDYLKSEVEKAQEKVKSEYKEEIDSLHSKIKELKHEVYQLALNEDYFSNDNQYIILD